jgi:beta-glucosidase
MTELDIDATIAGLTLEEKASLCSGSDFWHTEGIDRADISPLLLSDGPHGLRKQVTAADQHQAFAAVRAQLRVLLRRPLSQR